MEDNRTLAGYGISNASPTMERALYCACLRYIPSAHQEYGRFRSYPEPAAQLQACKRLKAEFERITGIPVAGQMLCFKGQPLNRAFLGLDIPVRESDTVDINFK